MGFNCYRKLSNPTSHTPMSLNSKENGVTSSQLDSLAVDELSSADLSGVSLALDSFKFSSSKHSEMYPVGREVVFVCAYGPISLRL